jgi:hypothetical protein
MSRVAGGEGLAEEVLPAGVVSNPTDVKHLDGAGRSPLMSANNIPIGGHSTLVQCHHSTRYAFHDILHLNRMVTKLGLGISLKSELVTLLLLTVLRRRTNGGRDAGPAAGVPGPSLCAPAARRG